MAVAVGHGVVMGSYQPLDYEQCQALADALGDAPNMVISAHVLRRGLCKAYVAGAPSRFDAAIVQADAVPREPTGFGADPVLLWDLLGAVAGWDCILVESACALALGGIIQGELDAPVRYLDDVCCTLSDPVPVFRDPLVRALTPSDIELLEAAPRELHESCFESTRDLLSGGIVACAILEGRVVATALTAARTARHAEIGVYTLAAWRGRGFATAAASVVAGRVQQAGQTPVWSAGAHNVPSLRIAEKLGFAEVSRKTYVILDRKR